MSAVPRRTKRRILTAAFCLWVLVATAAYSLKLARTYLLPWFCD